VKIPAGSKIVTTYVYDNSTRNPANPDPKKTITWGPQSWEEMHYTQVRYRWVGETSKNPVKYDAELNATRALGVLDANFDGKVQEGELRGATGKMLKAQFAKLDANKDGALEANELGPINAILARREAE
jgi:Ca2+-binding EF-hand superfamily protein